jgi:hypothetical protein
MQQVEGLRPAGLLISPAVRHFADVKLTDTHVRNPPLPPSGHPSTQNYGTRSSYQVSMKTIDKDCVFIRYLMTLFQLEWWWKLIRKRWCIWENVSWRNILLLRVGRPQYRPVLLLGFCTQGRVRIRVKVKKYWTGNVSLYIQSDVIVRCKIWNYEISGYPSNELSSDDWNEKKFVSLYRVCSVSVDNNFMRISEMYIAT